MKPEILKEQIADRVEELINRAFIFAHITAKTKHGDISPEQVLRLEELQGKLVDLIFEQVTDNL